MTSPTATSTLGVREAVDAGRALVDAELATSSSA